MKPQKHFLFILFALCSLCGASAQQYDKWFSDSTLRLDYVFAGNATTQHIFFGQAYSSPRWAGRKARLSETFLRGNGQISLSDHQTGELLFVHSFSTLFQEWLATEEARQVDRRIELTGEELDILSHKLTLISESIAAGVQPVLSVTWFIPDSLSMRRSIRQEFSAGLALKGFSCKSSCSPDIFHWNTAKGYIPLGNLSVCTVKEVTVFVSDARNCAACASGSSNAPKALL